MKLEDIAILERATQYRLEFRLTNRQDHNKAVDFWREIVTPQAVLDLITTFRQVDAARSALQQYVDQQKATYLLAQAVRMLDCFFPRDSDSPMQALLDKAKAFLKDYDEDAETERRAKP